MAKKKKHHFVPRFYLRNFSLDFKGSKISLFNLPMSKYVFCANLYDQAYKNYFYGKDLIIENALADLEKEASKIVNRILENSLPRSGSDEHYILLAFTLLLRERTVYAADRLNEFFGKTLKSIASEDPEALPKTDRFNFALTQSVQEALAIMASMIPLALDLRFKLIINQSNEAFITSDHPVVFYNQFFEPKKIPGGKIGIASKGLEIFLPLSPTHLLIFFDSDVYKIGTKNSTIIYVNDKKDVEQLNILQCVNCDKNLYFNQDIKEGQVRQLAKKSLRFRQQAKADIEKYLQRNAEKGQAMLLWTHMSELNCSLKLSFISFVKKARKFSPGNKVVHLRDEGSVGRYLGFQDEIESLIEKGQYERGDFLKFVHDVIDTD
ncbi:MAG: DUF4238 domain-containing protein [Elainellaceae cyanobacterium]